MRPARRVLDVRPGTLPNRATLLSAPPHLVELAGVRLVERRGVSRALVPPRELVAGLAEARDVAPEVETTRRVRNGVMIDRYYYVTVWARR